MRNVMHCLLGLFALILIASTYDMQTVNEVSETYFIEVRSTE